MRCDLTAILGEIFFLLGKHGKKLSFAGFSVQSTRESEVLGEPGLGVGTGELLL